MIVDQIGTVEMVLVAVTRGQCLDKFTANSGWVIGGEASFHGRNGIVEG